MGRQRNSILVQCSALVRGSLACMHGSAWQGDGRALLRALADSLGAEGGRERKAA